MRVKRRGHNWGSADAHNLGNINLLLLLFNHCVSAALLMWVKTDLMVIFIGHDIKHGLSAGAITQGVIIIIHKEL